MLHIQGRVLSQTKPNRRSTLLARLMQAHISTQGLQHCLFGLTISHLTGDVNDRVQRNLHPHNTVLIAKVIKNPRHMRHIARHQTLRAVHQRWWRAIGRLRYGRWLYIRWLNRGHWRLNHRGLGRDRWCRRFDRNSHRGRFGHPATGDGVGVGINPNEPIVRGVSDGAVRIDGNAAVPRWRSACDYGRAFKAIVAQHRCFHRCVHQGRTCIVNDVSDRQYRNFQDSLSRAIDRTLAVIDRIGNVRHLAIPVGHGSEGVGTSLVDHQSTVTRDGDIERSAIGWYYIGGAIDLDLGDGEHIARIRVGIDHVARATVFDDVAGDGRIFRGHSGVILGGRGTVVLDGDGQLGSGFIAIGIAHRVGEDIGHDGWGA